jgi:tetratricopeptide (TPR) repeat protein
MQLNLNQKTSLLLVPIRDLAMHRYIKLWLTTIIVATHCIPIAVMQKTTIAAQVNTLNESAKAVSVRINTSTEIEVDAHKGKGRVLTTQYTTGIIIHKDQDLFSVIVSDAILPETKWITTSDGQSHKISTIFNDLDIYGQKQLSLVQFRSSKNHPIAKISKTNKLLRRGEDIYISGITTGADRNPFGDFKMYNGQVAANRQGSFLYDNSQTVDLPIGGAIFNRYGEFIGFHNKNKWSINEQEDPRRGYSGYPHISLYSLYLHDDIGEYSPSCGTGRGRRRTIRDKYSSGILINDFSQLTKKINFKLPPEIQAVADSPAILVEDYIAIAINMYKNNKINESIRSLDAAIEIEPQNADLYSLRGMVLENSTNSSVKALYDYDRAIKLNPNDSLALFMRIKNNQAKNQWLNYESLLNLHPNNQVLYYLRGEFKRGLEDLAGALHEFDQMVAANLNSSESYLARGLFKEHDLKDFQGALADYKKLVKLENHPAVYDVLVRLQENKIKDFSGAVNSYNQAIKLGNGPGLYSKFTERRAQVKQDKLRDFAGALADYNQIISADPYNLAAYQLRADLKTTKLNDLDGALQDYNNLITFGHGQGNYP